MSSLVTKSIGFVRCTVDHDWKSYFIEGELTHTNMCRPPASVTVTILNEVNISDDLIQYITKDSGCQPNIIRIHLCQGWFSKGGPNRIMQIHSLYSKVDGKITQMELEYKFQRASGSTGRIFLPLPAVVLDPFQLHDLLAEQNIL